MEAEFLKQFKAVDDAAPTAATSDFWPTQFHGVDTIAFKADIANRDRFASQFFLG